jgi:transposase
VKPIKLSESERAALIAVAASTKDATQLRHAQALLWLDEDESVEEIADRLLVRRQTIYNWVRQFNRRADTDILTRLDESERSGRPRTAKGIIDPIIDEIIDQDPREFGYRSTIWTADLLRQFLQDQHTIEVSERSINLAIERLQIRWKRPRHQLALRPENWRQAKGGSNEG